MSRPNPIRGLLQNHAYHEGQIAILKRAAT
jgi:hypothetical protein